MAINTPERRFSIMNLTVVGASRIMPIPSGSIDDLERFHLLGLYSGLAPFPPVSTAAHIGKISISIGLDLS